MIAVVVSLICLLRPSLAYLNAYDQDLHFTCPQEYQSVSHVASIHDNHKEDRMFDIKCSEVIDGETDSKTSCFVTGRQNDFDHLLAFQCTGNHYISGMNSHHDNRHEDRVWWFRCCEMQVTANSTLARRNHHIAGVHLVDCDFTDWTNSYDGAQNFNVHAGKVMKGVTSVHDNGKEDRIYKYEICGVLQTDGNEVVGK